MRRLQSRAPGVGFGAVFPCILLHSSSLHLGNQTDSRITSAYSFIAVCWQLKPEKPVIPRRQQMHLISIPVLSDHAVLNTKHVETECLVMLTVFARPCVSHVNDHHVVVADDV
jgi:hypothetical protein